MGVAPRSFARLQIRRATVENEHNERNAKIARWLGMNVVAMDWPCGYEPECGCYIASHRLHHPADWCTERAPVYCPVKGGLATSKR